MVGYGVPPILDYIEIVPATLIQQLDGYRIHLPLMTSVKRTKKLSY